MQRIKAQLSVFFEEPYWIGIYERMEDGRTQACKIIFGAEPKDYEVYGYINDHWKELKFGPTVHGSELSERKVNPKRMQREISRQLRSPGTGTKAQEALKALQEASKTERKQRARLRKQEENDRQFELHRQKKKEKHKGR